MVSVTWLPGFLGPAPAAPADSFVERTTTSVCDEFGDVGLTGHAYDLGCAGGIGDPGATSDTLIGCFGLSAVVQGVATANGIHNRVTRVAECLRGGLRAVPPDHTTPIDHVVRSVTDRVRQAI